MRNAFIFCCSQSQKPTIDVTNLENEKLLTSAVVFLKKDNNKVIFFTKKGRLFLSRPINCSVWQQFPTFSAVLLCWINTNFFSAIKVGMQIGRQSLQTSHVTHQAGAYLLFQQDEATWSISTPPWMGCKSITGLPPAIKYAGTHLYTWVERGTVRVECLA